MMAPYSLLSSLFDSFEAKRLELEKWLGRMEQRAERMGTVATTADILEAQQKEQKVSPGRVERMLRECTLN